MLKYIPFIVVLLLGCGANVNRLLPESKDSFNPELTSIYNMLLHSPNSENRIIGITHYHLTAETIEFLDSIYDKIEHLPCKKDNDKCVYNFLSKPINGIMLRTHLATSWGNYTAMCHDRTDSLYMNKMMAKFAHASSDTNWVRITFLNKNKTQSLDELWQYKKIINDCALTLMKNIMNGKIKN